MTVHFLHTFRQHKVVEALGAKHFVAIGLTDDADGLEEVVEDLICRLWEQMANTAAPPSPSQASAPVPE
jgi:hypothetical protein